MQFDSIKEFTEYINLKRDTHILIYHVTRYSNPQFWDKINIEIISSKNTLYDIIDIILKSNNMKLEEYTIDASELMLNITFIMKDAIKKV